MDASSDMRTFVRVVERQSFAAAAEALGQTPSAVSKLVSRLEQRLGVRLLNRTTRRLALTSEGEIYFARARQILADIDEVEAEVAKVRGAPRGRLRVNTSHGFGVHQLARALPDFLARYPDIAVELTLTDRMVDPLTDPADITIRGGRITDTTLTARKIAEYERTICASPAYLARHGTPQAPADLARHICIAMSFQAPSHWMFDTRKGPEQIEIAPRLVTDSGDAALRLALEGAGIVRLADVVVGDSIQRGQLVALLADVHHAERLPLTALYLAGRHRLPKLRVFLDFLVERFGHAPWRSV